MVRHKMNIGDPLAAESHTKTRAASTPLNKGSVITPFQERPLLV